VVWRKGKLVDDGSFEQREGVLEWNNCNGDPYNAATGCDFCRVKGRTAILADMCHGLDWQGELFVFSGDYATQHRVLWSDADHDWQSPSTGILIDLDGKGVGALRFMNPRRGGPRFEFYRL